MISRSIINHETIGATIVGVIIAVNMVNEVISDLIAKLNVEVTMRDNRIDAMVMKTILPIFPIDMMIFLMLESSYHIF